MIYCLRAIQFFIYSILVLSNPNSNKNYKIDSTVIFPSPNDPSVWVYFISVPSLVIFVIFDPSAAIIVSSTIKFPFLSALIFFNVFSTFPSAPILVSSTISSPFLAFFFFTITLLPYASTVSISVIIFPSLSTVYFTIVLEPSEFVVTVSVISAPSFPFVTLVFTTFLFPYSSTIISSLISAPPSLYIFL